MDELHDSDIAPLLAAVDRDGAIAETAAAAATTRRGLMGLAGVAVGTLALGADRADAKPDRTDLAILNYALSLEYLQAAFYTEAEQRHALHGDVAKAAKVVGAVERAHVRAYHSLLGKRAVKRPMFDFHGVTESQADFLKTAVAFEDLAAAAYGGQAPRIRSKSVLTAAVAIHSVEARHAAWMRYLVGAPPATRAFDAPAGKASVLRTVADTHFITTPPRTSSRRRPRFTG